MALSTLFDATSDAIVLLDSNGMIREANEAFLVMADAAQLLLQVRQDVEQHMAA